MMAKGTTGVVRPRVTTRSWCRAHARVDKVRTVKDHAVRVVSSPRTCGQGVVRQWGCSSVGVEPTHVWTRWVTDRRESPIRRRAHARVDKVNSPAGGANTGASSPRACGQGGQSGGRGGAKEGRAHARVDKVAGQEPRQPQAASSPRTCGQGCDPGTGVKSTHVWTR
jgi:hypothetical protein